MSPVSNNLKAIVDIGSNGIRFSISSVDPQQARIFPCLFQDRAAISLFDALHSSSASLQTDIENNVIEDGQVDLSSTKQSISPSTIKEVAEALVRFKHICHDFGVSDNDVRVIATEATREAPNSVEFRAALKAATGWEVLLLSKADEGRMGAYGVASSFFEIQGLFADIGGGSMQVSWIDCMGGSFRMSETPVSLPYGAAALTRRLQREPTVKVTEELRERLSLAIQSIQIPEELLKSAAAAGGFKLYVCGGGFRGLGHMLLANHKLEKYPLPIINGFSCTSNDITRIVKDTMSFARVVDGSNKVFRISERRANQLPAVALLVSQALEVFPSIRKVLFSQGGVREGALFHDLPSTVRLQDPLIVATQPFAPQMASKYVEVLLGGLPSTTPAVIRTRIVRALVNVAFTHSSYPKELQSNAGLNIACTGIISGCHGLSHEVRVLLGLALCHRWGGDLPDKSDKEALISVANPKLLAWWACYCGHLMHVIGGVYPGGNVRELVMTLRTEEVSEKGFTVVLEAMANNVRSSAFMVRGRINSLEKKLKKMRKDFGRESSLKVKVQVIWRPGSVV